MRINSQKLQRKTLLAVFLLSSHRERKQGCGIRKKNVCLGAEVHFYQQNKITTKNNLYKERHLSLPVKCGSVVTQFKMADKLVAALNEKRKI